MTLPLSIATGGHSTDAEIVDLQNAVNALLASGPAVSVKTFGAKGDGVTDDTTAIQSALTYMMTVAGGGRVVLPNGQYKTSNYFTLTGGSHITIEGQGASLLLPHYNTPDGRSNVLNLVNASHIRVTGLRIVGTWPQGSGNTQEGLISTNTCTDIRIDHNRWEDCAGQSVSIDTASVRISVDHNDFINCNSGVQGASSPAVAAQDISITDNKFLGNVTYGVLGSDDQIAMFYASRVLIARNFINKQGPTAANQARGILLQTNGANILEDVDVVDNEIVNVITTTAVQAGAGIKANASVAGSVRRVNISRNVIRNVDIGIFVDFAPDSINITDNIVSLATVVGGVGGIGISVAHSSTHINIRGNRIDASGLDGISISTGSHVSVAGNDITATTRYGIVVDTSPDVSVTDNRVIGSADFGLFLNAPTRATVIGNKLNGGSTFGMRLAGTSPSGVFAANYLDSNSSGALSDGSTAPAWRVSPGGFGIGSTLTEGTITLTSATPSTGTATVFQGARCVVTNQTTQANPVKASVSGTTLTVTGPNTVTDVITYLCF